LLFISGGVFYYLDPERIRELVAKMSESFAGGFLVFDAESPLALSMANRMVRKSGNNGAEMVSLSGSHRK
jgi:O-methyltransferase involved in polyketide biosynthesis